MARRLTAAKMKECRWLKPVLVEQFEFTEWTPLNPFGDFAVHHTVLWVMRCVPAALCAVPERLEETLFAVPVVLEEAAASPLCP